MGYGDHKVWAPWKRWALATGYWTVCFALASLRGLPKKLLEHEVKTPNHFMYLVSFIGFVPVFIAAYDISAYAFNRELSMFSTIVWPIMHILDTLRWYFSFDVGRAIAIFVGTKLFGEEPSMLLQYIGGWAGFALFMIKHRETFELWYLPEHHPPRYARGNGLYIVMGIVNSIPMMWIFHYKDDMLFGVVMKYAFDLYVAMRIRTPAPWDPGNHEREAKDEAGVNKKYWDQYLLPSPNY